MYSINDDISVTALVTRKLSSLALKENTYTHFSKGLVICHYTSNPHAERMIPISVIYATA